MTICTYCGNVVGLHRHHEVPAAFSMNCKNFTTGTTIPACAECNKYLGSKVFSSREEAAYFLIEKYKLKYKKVLSLPKWTEDELEDMGSNISTSIREATLQKEILEERLINLRVCAGLQSAVFQE